MQRIIYWAKAIGIRLGFFGLGLAVTLALWILWGFFAFSLLGSQWGILLWFPGGVVIGVFMQEVLSRLARRLGIWP